MTLLNVYTKLLAQPDPPDLPPRRRRYICGGDVLWRDIIKRDLERAYARHLVIDAGRAESSVVSVRRSPIHRVRRNRS